MFVQESFGDGGAAQTNTPLWAITPPRLSRTRWAFLVDRNSSRGAHTHTSPPMTAVVVIMPMSLGADGNFNRRRGPIG